MVESKPKTDDLVLIPGGKGKAVRMKKGDTIKIINTHGSQACSTNISHAPSTCMVLRFIMSCIANAISHQAFKLGML